MAYKYSRKRRSTSRRRRRVVRRRRRAPLVGKQKGMGLQFKRVALNRKSQYLTFKSTLNKTHNDSVVPMETYRALPYYDIYTLLFGVNSYAYQVMRLNALFDPDYTGGGHQPRGFDQYALLYWNYQVYGCLVEALFSTKDTTLDSFRCFIVGNKQENSFVGGALELNEAPNGPVVFGDLTNTNRRCYIRKYFPMAQIAGVSRGDYNTLDQFTALTTANPNYVITCQVGAYTMDGSTNTAGLDVHITITYFSRFFRPRTLTAS